MIKSLKEIENYVLENGIKKTIALACAHDEPALSAVVNVKRKGLANAILVGKEDHIAALLKEFGENPDEYEIIDCSDEAECARITVALVKEGKADIPMKGIMQTSTFMKAILNRETGVAPAGNIISYAAVFEHPDEERLVMFTDPAINIAPDGEQKIKIIENTAPLAKALGYNNPKVAMISAVEKVSPKMQSTVDAKAVEEKGVSGFVVEGPLAFDGAISSASAEHKGIESLVAGKADILIMPNICSGNVLYKTLTYVAKKTVVGTVLGASVPVVMTSRADTSESKYFAILLAMLQCR